MTLIFNHIPKTGGITFRGILSKVYKPENIYFIDSLNIVGSIQDLKNMTEDERSIKKVIAGHGAEFISKIIDKPFKVTILREPVSLFISQYNFLKSNTGTVFLNDVRALDKIENYLDYAINKGQDNLLTRYLSSSTNFLIDPTIAIQDMETEGKEIFEEAKKNLLNYDALLNLETFDRGIFSLSKKLGWNKIPIYRPHNQNKSEKKSTVLNAEFELRLRHALRFDIALYNLFLELNLDIASQVSPQNINYRMFFLRQKILNFIGRFVTA